MILAELNLKVGVYIRNKIDFLNVHGIMNILGLLQIEVKPECFHVNFAREPKYS